MFVYDPSAIDNDGQLIEQSGSSDTNENGFTQTADESLEGSAAASRKNNKASTSVGQQATSDDDAKVNRDQNSHNQDATLTPGVSDLSVASTQNTPSEKTVGALAKGVDSSGGEGETSKSKYRHGTNDSDQQLATKSSNVHSSRDAATVTQLAASTSPTQNANTDTDRKNTPFSEAIFLSWANDDDDDVVGDNRGASPPKSVRLLYCAC